MKILVLLKEVPVVSNIQIDRQTLKIDRSGAGKIYLFSGMKTSGFHHESRI